MARRSDDFNTLRRSIVLGTAAAAAWAATGCARAPVAATGTTPRLRFIGQAIVPWRLAFQGTTVGGLSGLDYDPAQDLWYALSDDRSDINPARWYTLRLKIGADSLGAPEFTGVTTLLREDGSAWPSRRAGAGLAADPESLRLRPGTGTVLWSSEGDARQGSNPFIRESDLRGRHLRELPLLPMFTMDTTQARGPRDNLSFEGLAFVPGGAQLWVSMEAALIEDGPVPTASAPGGPCRITQMDTASGQALRQIAYVPDPIPQPSVPPGAYADNGISEILMIDARRMLVLERAYITGFGNSLRLYEIDTTAASDTLGVAVLREGNHQPVRKTLVADFAKTGLPRLDNTEGMAWGPLLPSTAGGAPRRTLVFVSDDNFNPAQITQFAAFEYTDTP